MIKKEIGIGFLVSVFVTICSFYIYVEFISNLDFNETLKVVKQNGVLSSVITLSAIPNLLVFFIFLRKKQDYRARGVLLATLAIAILTFVLRFL